MSDTDRIKALEIAFSANDPASTEKLMNLYYVKKDFAMMEKYCLIGIAQNIPEAKMYLAYCYHNTGVYPDLVKKYYKLAFKEGLIKAANGLAVFYSQQKIFEKTKKYLQIAVAGGWQISMENLSTYYSEFEPNIKKSMKYRAMSNLHRAYNPMSMMQTQESDSE